MATKFLPGRLPSKLLLAMAVVTLGLGSAALAQTYSGESHASQPAPTILQPDSGTVDLTGVPLGDLVRLYLSRVDDRSYVACSDLLSDTRKVSLRAPGSLSKAALEGLLERHGYSFETRHGVTYVCPIAISGEVPSGSPIVVTDDLDTLAPVAQASVYAAVSAGASSKVDRLLSNGFVPAGCVDRGDGTISYALKGPSHSIMVTRADVKASQASDLFICRI